MVPRACENHIQYCTQRWFLELTMPRKDPPVCSWLFSQPLQPCRSVKPFLSAGAAFFASSKSSPRLFMTATKRTGHTFGLRTIISFPPPASDAKRAVTSLPFLLLCLALLVSPFPSSSARIDHCLRPGGNGATQRVMKNLHSSKLHCASQAAGPGQEGGGTRSKKAEREHRDKERVKFHFSLSNEKYYFALFRIGNYFTRRKSVAADLPVSAPVQFCKNTADHTSVKITINHRPLAIILKGRRKLS